MALAQSIEGFARVTGNGYVVIGGREVALFGIDIPTYDRTCRQATVPTSCGPRAVLILEDLVRGFVHCDIVGRRSADLLDGRCTVAGERMLDDRRDLAQEMLRQGWAFTRPEAPPLYHSLQLIARSREIGIWRDAAVNLR